MSETEEALAALRAVPGFEATGAVPAVRLGGLTNRVWRLDTRPEPVVLRLPGAGTEAYIDREVEAVNARAAAAAGVSPAVLHVDAGTGVMLTRHVDGETMTPERFRTTPGAPARAAAAFRQLHTSGVQFAFRFELFAMIDEYLGVLDGLGATLPEGYHDVVRDAGRVRAALGARPAVPAPCHCDPLCENFIDTGTRMWLVDWEYSGMNDPLWDLGDLSVEAGFGPAQDAEMLAAYCGGEPSPEVVGRVVAYKAMCDLLWTLWGLIQHAHSNPAEDFWAYSVRRFERCKALMAAPDFPHHLAAAAGR